MPGGPAASVEWASATLPAGAVAVQMRTWNLSAIWRFDVDGAPVAWLKQVPGFFAHEPALLRLLTSLATIAVPAVLDTGDAGRMLLATFPARITTVPARSSVPPWRATCTPVQHHFAARPDLLLAAGVPDRRRDYDRLVRAAEPWLEHLDGLDDLLDELPARLAALAACGLPDTLVHGDLHPGNVRAEPGGPRTILDWGDATLGNPALDIIRLTEGLGPAARPVLDRWAQRWRASVPGCDPLTAVELTRPVAALRAAAGYQGFLDRIEASEHPYHRDDVPRCLAEAVAAAQPAPR